jgi:hypothetical protein
LAQLALAAKKVLNHQKDTRPGHENKRGRDACLVMENDEERAQKMSALWRKYQLTKDRVLL